MACTPDHRRNYEHQHDFIQDILRHWCTTKEKKKIKPSDQEAERSIVVQCQIRNFSTISWREQVNFQRDDDEVHFVLDQHPELDFLYSSSSLKRSAGRHASPLTNQSLLFLHNAAWLVE